MQSARPLDTRESIPLGQHPAPTHVIAHLSDTHLLAGAAPLYGLVDTESKLRATAERLRAHGERLDAIVVTGDIGDRGEPDAYDRVAAILDPLAVELGAELIWVMGNHDARVPFRERLLGETAVTATATDASPSADASTPSTTSHPTPTSHPSPTSRTTPTSPVDRVVEVNGLRIVALDTSVPGFHHGELDADQLAWLAEVLAEPAEHGTILALHHPPVPTPLAAMTVLELHGQAAFADVVRGTDVRAVLGGHLHYSTAALFAGVPVFVSAAVCYTMDLGAPSRELEGVDGGQSFALVHVYPETIASSTVPIGSFDPVTRFGADFLDRLEALDAAGRIDLFSRIPDGA